VNKTILITGSTDGIGLETARTLVSMGHNLLIHGRNPAKLEEVEKSLSETADGGSIEAYVADLSRMSDVEAFAKAVTERHDNLDALINNAGVFRTPKTTTPEGLDTRFAVNTIAPCLLTQRLMPLLGSSGRVINLSSAAQSPVNFDALAGRIKLSDDLEAYAQSKLAITMWSRHLGLTLNENAPCFVAVNPGSLLGTKMVREAFGMAGKDVRIGADILIRAALSDEFESVSGQYFDNDPGRFASPHRDALDPRKSGEVVLAIEAVLADLGQQC